MNNIKISHNPSGSQTIIEIPSEWKPEKTQLAIFDILGQEVVTANVGNDNKAVISRNNLSSGIYFYRIFQNGSLIACGKLALE